MLFELTQSLIPFALSFAKEPTYAVFFPYQQNLIKISHVNIGNQINLFRVQIGDSKEWGAGRVSALIYVFKLSQLLLPLDFHVKKSSLDQPGCVTTLSAIIVVNSNINLSS